MDIIFFTANEVNWICRDLIRENNVIAPTSAWNQSLFDDYNTKYGLPITVLHDWVDMYLRGEPMIPGRPCISCPIDVVGIGVLSQLMAAGRAFDESEGDFHARFDAALENQQSETAERRAFYIKSVGPALSS